MALLKKIEEKTAIIGVIGLGYVGLPLVVNFLKTGFKVIGFDSDVKKVKALNHGRSYIKHMPASLFTPYSSRFSSTTDISRLKEPDVIIICVPTPLTENREPDMQYVEKAARDIARNFRGQKLVSLESTTYPGTTEELILPILQEKGLVLGKDFYLVFSPEREDPGNDVFSVGNIPKVVGGIDSASLKHGIALYKQIVKRVVPVSSTRVAESTKLLENIYRSVNIAMVNEMKMLFDRMGIDIWEVIEASKTKPFGFQAFYPGPGLGGHCLSGSEKVRVRNDKFNTVMPLSKLFTLCNYETSLQKRGEVEFLKPRNLETISVDPITRKVSWKKVSHLFKRTYTGSMLDIRLQGNFGLRVTDRHPMLVVKNDCLLIKEARELKSGDRIPQFSDLSNDENISAVNPEIDLLACLPEQIIDKLHIRIKNDPWRNHEKLLKSCFGWQIRDSIRKNSLSARRFLKIESQLDTNRRNIMLLQGKGNSHTSFPAVLTLTPDFCRFLGYFLSEGCISEERGRPRVRLTFNRDEIDLIQDTSSILSILGIRISAYNDKKFHATTLRVGSTLLGTILRDILHCGVSSTTMRIPKAIMNASLKHKEQLVAGLIRGDGDVYVSIGKRSYQKNGREYCHEFNSGTVGYFSSSPELLAQTESLLLELGFQFNYKKGKPYLRISGREDLERLIPLLSENKRAKLIKLRNARVRHITPKNLNIWSGGHSLCVKNVVPKNSRETVYSIEVPDYHTFATTGGLFVHNCIPVDPFYLTWKARQYDFATRFIELAGEINTAMPYYVISKTMEALNKKGKGLNKAKLLVLGVAYKKDVDDLRESPALKIIQLLREKGAEVRYNDPYIPKIENRRHYKFSLVSQKLTAKLLKSMDAILILTNHTVYNYTFIVKNARLVIDTRNAVAKMYPNVVKA